MQTQIHPQKISCKATCSSCGAQYDLYGVYENAKLSVEQCRACHQAFTGKRTAVRSGREVSFNERYDGFDFTKLKKKAN